jgi:hypothetical protein
MALRNSIGICNLQWMRRDGGKFWHNWIDYDPQSATYGVSSFLEEIDALNYLTRHYVPEYRYRLYFNRLYFKNDTVKNIPDSIIAVIEEYSIHNPQEYNWNTDLFIHEFIQLKPRQRSSTDWIAADEQSAEGEPSILQAYESIVNE